MASKVLTNALININSNDLSAYANSVTLKYEADVVEETAFGDDTHVSKGGLKNWSMDIEFNHDYADNLLDEILFALVGTQVTCAVRPENTTIGTGNPEYTGTGLVVGYDPVRGAVGELAKTTVRIVSAGTLTRDVTP